MIRILNLPFAQRRHAHFAARTVLCLILGSGSFQVPFASSSSAGVGVFLQVLKSPSTIQELDHWVDWGDSKLLLGLSIEEHFLTNAEKKLQRLFLLKLLLRTCFLEVKKFLCVCLNSHLTWV